MKCLSCGGESYVIDSRHKSDRSIRRRRKCSKCGDVWNTLEIDAESYEELDNIVKLEKQALALTNKLQQVRSKFDQILGGQ